MISSIYSLNEGLLSVARRFTHGPIRTAPTISREVGRVGQRWWVLIHSKQLITWHEGTSYHLYSDSCAFFIDGIKGLPQCQRYRLCISCHTVYWSFVAAEQLSPDRAVFLVGHCGGLLGKSNIDGGTTDQSHTAYSGGRSARLCFNCSRGVI